MTMDNNRVLIGISGGVDSAAAAILLRQAGYEPAGCMLHLHDAGQGPEEGCGSVQAEEDARRLAEGLGMPFELFDFSQQFRQQVMDNFVAEYADGRTPNPCIRCNRYIKFDALLQRADTLGIAYIATGHYARVRYHEEEGRWQLLRGLDRRKDQSYVLYPLQQRHLSRLLLPVGDYEKADIRALALSSGLINANKPDSQDICFVPDGDYVGFLRRYGGVEPVPGDFVDTSGAVLGRHKGQECYTTGQRRGLGVSADRPLYVLGKNSADNTVVLGDNEELFSRTVWAEDFNWVSLAKPDGPVTVTAKTRYSQTEAAAILYPEADGRVRAVFEQPQRAVTAGQALVAYQGDVLVGGGTICGAEM